MIGTVFDFMQSIGAGLRGAGGINADSVGQPFQGRAAIYDLLESFYTNIRLKEHRALMSQAETLLQTEYGIYRGSRSPMNPTHRAVDWWPGHVYPGTWTSDGLPASNGKPNRIPYDTDTPEEVRLAVQQAYTWGNWGSEILQYVRTGAMLGDVFVEVEVNLERRKTFPKLLHPRFVVDMEWNSTGDVVMYRVEIPQTDDKGNTFTWGKQVDKEKIATFRDGKPYGIDELPAQYDNPWNLVPAVWVQHRNIGGQHGAPVIDGVYAKIVELNALVSAVNDFIRSFIDQSIVVATDDPRALSDHLKGQGGTQSASTGLFGGRDDQTLTRRILKVMPAKNPVAVHRLLENLGLGESESHIQRLAEEIEKDLPELTLSEKLLDKQNMSRPGAMPLVQDVQHKLDESVGNYDAGIVALGQMCVAIQGHEMRAGTMGKPSEWTDAMRIFLPFDLSSYDKGDLDFGLTPRELVPPTATDLAAESVALEAIKTPSGLRRAGLSDLEIFGPLPDGQTDYPRTGIQAELRDTGAGGADAFASFFNSGAV